jgi:hypothetical protein
MWFDEHSETPRRLGGGAKVSLDALRLRLPSFAEAPDQVGDVRRLLLQVALVLLQAPEQRLGIGEPPVVTA